MNWDKKSVIATIVCFLFVMGYMYHLQNKYPDYYSSAQQTSDVPVSAVSTDPSKNTAASPVTTAPAPAAADAIAALAEAELVFDNPQRTIRFDQTRGGIASIHLKDYAAQKGEKDPINILDGEWVLQATPTPSEKVIKSNFKAKREGNKIAFTRTEGLWELTQSYTFPSAGYGFEVELSFRNLSDKEQDLKAAALIKQTLDLPTSSSSFFVPSSPSDIFVTYSLAGTTHDSALAGFCEAGGEPAVSLRNEKVDYLGIDKHYFLGLAWAKNQNADYLVERDAESNSAKCTFTTTIGQQFGNVAAGSTTSMKLVAYFGPKQREALEAFDPGLKSAIKLGWFTFFANPLFMALKGIHQAVQNWGLAIIIVTLILKLAFYPLTRSAAISTKRMQKIQPEMNALRERFKDDPPRQQKEIMAFMAQNKVNPFKGCLPMLPQIPVFIAFYNLLSQSIELRHAPFYGWLIDLSSKDPYYITPILLGVAMFVQQKLTPNPGMDKNQEKIMLLMPIMFSLFMLSLPAGMVLYMMTNTIVSIAQQQWLNRRLALKDI